METRTYISPSAPPSTPIVHVDTNGLDLLAEVAILTEAAHILLQACAGSVIPECGDDNNEDLDSDTYTEDGHEHDGASEASTSHPMNKMTRAQAEATLSSPPTAYTCHKCLRVFLSKQGYTSHKCTRCTSCNRTFKTMQSLKNHQLAAQEKYFGQCRSKSGPMSAKERTRLLRSEIRADGDDGEDDGSGGDGSDGDDEL